MGAPSGRAEVFASGRVRAFSARLGVGFGASVGNKLAALTAGGLWEGFAVGMPGRLPTAGRVPTGSCEMIVPGVGGSSVDATGGNIAVRETVEVFEVGEVLGVGEVVGFGGAVMATVAAAVEAFGRPAALPVAIRLTEVTFVAVTGTVSRA